MDNTSSNATFVGVARMRPSTSVVREGFDNDANLKDIFLSL